MYQKKRCTFLRIKRMIFNTFLHLFKFYKKKKDANTAAGAAAACANAVVCTFPTVGVQVACFCPGMLSALSLPSRPAARRLARISPRNLACAPCNLMHTVVKVRPTLLAIGRHLGLNQHAAKRRQSCSDVPPAVQAGAGAQRYARIRENSENTGKGVLFFVIPYVSFLICVAD